MVPITPSAREIASEAGCPLEFKAQHGRVYLLTGQAGQSINAELADYAAKIVTIEGSQSVREGFAQLRVEEIPKFQIFRRIDAAKVGSRN